MKKSFSIIFSVILIICLFSGCSKVEYTEFEHAEHSYIRVVSYNCAAPWGNILQGTGSGTRVKKFAAYMTAVHPDSIGTQEMNQKWLDALFEDKEIRMNYSSYGQTRGGDENENKSEMNAIFWLHDKYTAEAKGTFWLSETPDTMSKYEGAGCYRICTWVVLCNKATGKKYIHMNTHLDNASEEAANYGAQVISAKMDELSAMYDAPVVLTGDFNETQGMIAYNTIAEKLSDTQIIAETTEKKTTYQAWGDVDSGEPIDFIFVPDNSSVSQYKVLDDLSNGYVSDHYGIIADFKLN
ncbi:MAG: endonuclease/exonuclease/phosphatase family protein [Eubacterium sp.]|nr:endonuclease/exonuclease/phosphatase family protein [Eubacterium sp.]